MTGGSAAPAGGAAVAARVTPPHAEPDRNAQAKTHYDQGREALDEGDAARALVQADASLKLRRTARTYLLRSQALQRLDRTDEAIAAVDAAAAISPELGAVWELRGRILWSVRRYDEARAAFTKYLAIEPNSPRGPSIRRMLSEPR